MQVKSEREVAQSCPTLSDPMDCSLPGSSTHGIFQARVLEGGAIAFSGCNILVVKHLAVYIYFGFCISKVIIIAVSFYHCITVSITSNILKL